VSAAGDEGLPARARGGWVMALVRLFAGWLIAARPLGLLLGGGSPLAALAAPVARFAIAALLGLGLVAFAWPKSCQRGLALLLAGLAADELVVRDAGLAPTPGRSIAVAVAILCVLALGEWLTRRLEARR
jgi:hypothetical protein